MSFLQTINTSINPGEVTGQILISKVKKIKIGIKHIKKIS